MSEHKVIEAAWEAYLANVVPRSASAEQVNDMRNSFYAGAVTLYNGIMGNLTPGPRTEDGDLAMLEGIQHELEEHALEAAAVAKAVADG